MTLLKKIFLSSFFIFVFSGIYAQNSSQIQSENNSSEAVIQDAGNISWADLDNSTPSTTQETRRTRRNNSAASVWIFFRMIFGLAVVIFLIWLVLRFMKKTVRPSVVDDDTFLRKISGISLGASNSVQIVTLMDKGYVLGVSEEGISLIDSIDDKELVDAMNVYADRNGQVSKPKNFDDILELFISNGKFSRKKKDETVEKTAFTSAQELLDSLKEKNQDSENEK